MHSCASLKNQKMYLKCQLGTLAFDTHTQKNPTYKDIR